MPPAEKEKYTLMTADEALEFLRAHQPLPASDVIDENLLRRFDDVCQYFASYPDIRSIPLILNSFGEGDGHGVYQLVADTLLAHPEDVVVAGLLESLRSPSESIRLWSAMFSANYSRPELVAPLADILRQDCADNRMFAAIALRVIGTPKALKELQIALGTETEADIKEVIQEALGI